MNRVAEIDKLDRVSAIDLAKRLRNKYRNVSLDKGRLMTRVGATVASVGSAYVIGHYMGGLQHEYEMNASAIDAGTMEDPRKIIGMDIDLAVGFALTALGLGMQGLLGGKARKKAGMAADIVEASGSGILAFYFGSLGATAGKESALEA